MESIASHALYSTEHLCKVYQGHNPGSLPPTCHLKYLACYDRDADTNKYNGICPAHSDLRDPMCEFCNYPTHMLTRTPAIKQLPPEVSPVVTMKISNNEKPTSADPQKVQFFDKDHLGTVGKESRQ